jgi:IS30 family transposase
LFSCELASAISQFQREDFQRTLVRRANEQKERFDAYKAIDNRLRTIESGDSFGWWELNLAFLADERGQLVEEFSSDLTATKFGRHLSCLLRSEFSPPLSNILQTPVCKRQVVATVHVHRVHRTSISG